MRAAGFPKRARDARHYLWKGMKLDNTELNQTKKENLLPETSQMKH